MLPRRTKFSLLQKTGPPAEQDVPLPLKPKTKLFVELAAREREDPGTMHAAFQRDLARLRLKIARSFVESSAAGAGAADGTAGTAGGQVRASAEVSGLGPSFLLTVSLTNAGARMVRGMVLALEWDAAEYRVEGGGPT